MADEKRLPACRRSSLQFPCGLGRRRLSRRGGRAEQNAVLYVGGLWPSERRHLDAHANKHGNAFASGANWLPGGSTAGLPRRQIWMGEILRKFGASIDADRLKF